MSAGDIYCKTALGSQEVANRKLKLPPRVRTMLILIDGRQPAFILKEEAEKLAAPADFLEQLLQAGLIEKLGGSAAAELPTENRLDSGNAGEVDEFSRFRAVKDFMNVTVVDALGIKSFFFTLKLERAGNLADLRGLVSGFHAAISKGAGEDEASILTERLNALLR